MTRVSILVLVSALAAYAQETTPASTAPIIEVPVQPLAPPDLNSPYASPRDAARHRLQATLSDLAANRNMKEALRGFAQAFLLDRTYTEAAFNLAVVAAIAEKWDDAIGAFEEVARLGQGGSLGAAANGQLERLRLLALLEKSPEGKRRRRYDEALFPVLDKLPKLPPAEAMAALAEVGQIDPKRWEAPALLAGLNGDGHGYDTASQFLEIAAANAADPAVKAALEKARRAAERELQYAAARAAAEAAADRGDYSRAAELYQAAWTAVPARAANGLDAASVYLLCDDTAHAAALLARLRAGGDREFERLAAAMLKEIEPIEPAAKNTAEDAAQFFHDPGPREPVRIATLIPPIDRKQMEIYSRPLPTLADDPQPVILLASLGADASGAAPALPDLPPPVISGENPWRELSAMRDRAPSAPGTPQPPRPAQSADLAGFLKSPRSLHVATEPAGAAIFVNGAPQPACEAPCDIRIPAGTYAVRLALAGYRDEERTIKVAHDTEDLAIAFTVARGSVIVETPTPAQLKVNGVSIGAQSPAELSLAAGVYRIAADFGTVTRERFLTVKPAARLRLQFRP